jgi:urease accessory protein
VTVFVNQLLGDVWQAEFAGRRVVEVPVAWDEASRRRLRRTASDGTDVAIDIGPNSYLADGAVLDDDGQRVLVVARSREPALLVRFDLSLPGDQLVEQATAVGHAFGNQHVPVDVAAGEVRVPLTTSEHVARATVDGLGLDGVTMTVSEVALGARAPLSVGHGHGHGAGRGTEHAGE